ncbi:molybdopterin-guanine dinucleotide biosynthesis protein MobB [Shigella sonnei]
MKNSFRHYAPEGSVGLIKHTHHDMDVHKPGKIVMQLRKAGAAQTIVASQQRWALMTEDIRREIAGFAFSRSQWIPQSWILFWSRV